MVGKLRLISRAILAGLVFLVMATGRGFAAPAPAVTKPVRVAVLPVVDLVEGERTGDSLTLQLTSLLLQRFQASGYQMIDDKQLQKALDKHNYFVVSQKKEDRHKLLSGIINDLQADVVVMLALDDYGIKEPITKGQNDLIIAYLKMDNIAIFSTGKVIRETPSVERTYEYLWNRNGLESNLAMKSARDFLHKVDKAVK